MNEPDIEVSADEMASAVKDMGSLLGNRPEPAERPRDESGKFVAKEPVEATPEPTTPAERTPVPTPAPASEAVEPLVAPTIPPKEGEVAPVAVPAPEPRPTTWTPAALAEWDKIPPVVRAEIMKREGDMHKGIEQYKARAQAGDLFLQTLQPFEQAFRQFNVEPLAHIRNLLGFHHQMATGTRERRVDIIKALASDFGLSIDDFGGTMPADGGYVDPQVSALQSRLDSAIQSVNGLQSAWQATRKAEITAQIEAFARDPKHPYFADVEDDIARLIQSGVQKDLATAYDAAVWANPTVRAKVLADQRKASEAANAAAAQAESERAAAAARAKAANVQVTPKAQTRTKPNGSMDDTMRAKLDELMG